MKRSFGLVATCCVLTVAWAAPVPTQKYHFVDLQPKANQKLTDNPGGEGNNLKELPTGVQTFEGVKFKVGPAMIQLGSKELSKMPAQVGGIEVGHTFSKLHILHATGFGGGPNAEGSEWFVKDNSLIGEYRVNFEDKTLETIPIVYGKDVRDWFYIDGEKEVSRGKVAWTGDNEYAKSVGARIRLYLTTWENPKPGKKVVSIDYLSRKDETVAAPFCVAITLETK